ncbi:MAG: hypothetical protein BroJett025_11190 [Patescibacteria group bacterium]|nr:MAG: hypothetical protein BroJett025_11190 [Patescibacteria group bacterium]
MKFLLFKLRLALHLFVFILKLTANFSNKTKPAILAFFIIGLVLFIGGISLLNTTQKPVEVVSASAVIPKNVDLFVAKRMTKEQIALEINSLEKVLAIQPHSRDILLNLSLLYAALGETQKAEEYKNTARIIDPNNPIFE